MSEKFKIVPCSKSGEGKVAEIIGIILGYMIAASIVGIILIPILAVSYIIPVINIPAIFLIGIRDELKLGFWKGILSFVGLCVGVGFLIGLQSSYNTFSTKNLKRKLISANFRAIKKDDHENPCFWCEHHGVILLDKSDPDNSKRQFYCKYFPFKFEGVDSAHDLSEFTCDCYKSDGLIEELVDVIKSQSPK